MTETTQVWLPVKEALSPFGIIQRIETPLTQQGFPDTAYSLLGVGGLLELKIAPRIGKAPSHLTLEQVIFGESWSKAPSCGLWHLLMKVDTEWLLYDIIGARALLTGKSWTPLLHRAGKFPTTEMMAYLAPRERRWRAPAMTSDF
jgi:hypothetical protein